MNVEAFFQFLVGFFIVPMMMLGLYLCIAAFIHVRLNSGKAAAIMTLPVVIFAWVAFILSISKTFREILSGGSSSSIDLGSAPFLGALFSVTLIVFYLKGVQAKK